MANGFRVCWNIFPIVWTAVALGCVLTVIIAGTTSKNDLADIYFMRINTTDITATSGSESIDVESIAKSLGLRDFYQNSLWGYCEGYGSSGTNVTFCSKPQANYAFDPTEIFSSELVAGENITIPTSVEDQLDKVKTATRWMFALYLSGISVVFTTFLVGLTTLCSRRGSVCATCTACLSFTCVGIATVIAQVMFSAYANVINDTVKDFNVTASLGKTMFILSWGATAAALLAFVGFMFGICCGEGAPRYTRVGRGIQGDKPMEPEAYPLRTQYYG